MTSLRSNDTKAINFDNISDLHALGNGDAVVVTTDGRVSVIQANAVELDKELSAWKQMIGASEDKVRCCLGMCGCEHDVVQFIQLWCRPAATYTEDS